MKLHRPSTVAALVGLAVGVGVFLLVGPVVDPARAWFAAGNNALVWALAVGAYGSVSDRVAVLDGRSDGSFRTHRWDGFLGLVASGGVAGVVFMLPDVVPVRYALAVASFVGGVCFCAWIAGIGWKVERHDAGGGAAATARESTVSQD